MITVVSRRFLLPALLIVAIGASLLVFNLFKSAGTITFNRVDTITFQWSGQAEGETVTINPNWPAIVGGLDIPSFNRFSLTGGVDEAAKKLGSVPMLPTLLPEGMTYADVYVGPVVIIAYSYRSTEDYTFADMGIEISHAPYNVPTPEQIKSNLMPPLQLIQIGDMSIILNPKANVRDETVVYACFCYGDLYYQVGAKPPLTGEDLIKIIGSMKIPR